MVSMCLKIYEEKSSGYVDWWTRSMYYYCISYLSIYRSSKQNKRYSIELDTRIWGLFWEADLQNSVECATFPTAPQSALPSPFSFALHCPPFG